MVLVAFCWFDKCCSHRCEIVSHCGFVSLTVLGIERRALGMLGEHLPQSGLTFYINAGDSNSEPHTLMGSVLSPLSHSPSPYVFDLHFS